MKKPAGVCLRVFSDSRILYASEFCTFNEACEFCLSIWNFRDTNVAHYTYFHLVTRSDCSGRRNLAAIQGHSLVRGEKHVHVINNT